MTQSPTCCCFFFFNDTATTEIYTLSLHDALPISLRIMFPIFSRPEEILPIPLIFPAVPRLPSLISPMQIRLPEVRSEEHTSELQSQSNLVCRLLLEKKKSKHSPRIRAADDPLPPP